MATFIHPGTKFGFEKNFGQEAHKRILIEFLNAVVEGDYNIGNITYQNTSVISGPEAEQRVIHGIFCSQDDGAPIILEWQNKDIVPAFINRVIYFQSGAICAQEATLDFWKNIPIFVYILDFVQKDLGNRFRIDAGLRPKVIYGDPQSLSEIQKKGRVEGELERMIFLQMPEFQKSQEECITALDRWMYILKNMETLSEIPWANENEVFSELARVARLDNLTPEEREMYEKSYEVFRNI